MAGLILIESARRLRRQWRSNLVVIGVIGFGSCLVLAVFATINAYLWTEAGIPGSERVVYIESRRGGDKPQRLLPSAAVEFLIREASGFAAIGASRGALAGVDLGDFVQGARATRATAGLFEAYGMAPRAGRFFTKEEVAADAPVVIISESFWRNSLGAVENVVGRELRVDQRVRIIVGVVSSFPEEFEETLLWVPLVLDARDRRDFTYPQLRVVGSLRHDVGSEQVQQELARISRNLELAEPAQIGKGWNLVLRSWREEYSAPLRPVLGLLVSAALTGLLVAAVNASAIKLIGFTADEPRLAIKHALGALPLVLALPVVVEAGVLALCGTVLGYIGAPRLLILLLRDSAQTWLPDLQASSGSWLPAAGGGVALFVFFVLIAIPLRRMARTSWGEQLQRRHASEREVRRYHRAAIVVQLGLAFALSVSAGGMLQAWRALRQIDLGFEPKGVSTLFVGAAASRYASPEQQRHLAAALEQSLTATAGVARAAVALKPPLVAGWLLPYQVHGEPTRPSAELPQAAVNLVSANYLATIGLRLRAGRWFTEADGERSQLVAVVNRTLAKQHFRDGEAVGKWIYPIHGATGWRLIVGVVDDVKLGSLSSPTEPQIYQPFTQHPALNFSLVYSAQADISAPGSVAIRKAVARVDVAQPIDTIYRLEDFHERKLARARAVSRIIMAVALFSVGLCLVGFGALVSYASMRRGREFGLRMALGATARNVFVGVIRESLCLTGGGVLIGLIGALLLSQTMSKLVALPIQAHAANYVGALVLLVGVTLVATIVPAWRASRVDPAKALREE